LQRVRPAARSSRGLLLEAAHLVGRVRLQRAARVRGASLDARDVRREAFVRGTERGLRIEAGQARGADEVEEEVAEKVFVVDVERELETGRFELHACGALLHPLCRKQPRELARHAAEERLRGALFLIALDPLPLREQIASGDLLPLEDMRMPPDELLVELPRDLGGVEGALLTSELRVNGDLEEKIAELVAEARRIA